jgi:2-keto-3-deoxy-L-rhamnonate aldolase RhmA
MKNKLKRALLERRPTTGAWIQIGHPVSAEILARSGFDWVCVDLEHGIVDLESAAGLFRAVELHGSVPVARLPKNDPVWIHRMLDAGAQGLIVPMVNSEQEAEAAVREAKYPPRGARGYGYSRANAYGEVFSSAIREANEEIAMIMQIEHRDAIANLEGIIGVPDVDGLFIGPMDLSGSFGKPGDLECPEMREALRRYLSVCERHKKSAGLHIVRPDADNVRKAITDGYTLIALGLDTVFLAEGAARSLEEIRKVEIR